MDVRNKIFEEYLQKEKKKESDDENTLDEMDEESEQKTGAIGLSNEQIFERVKRLREIKQKNEAQREEYFSLITTLYESRGLTPAQIGEKIGMSPAGVRKLLLKAKESVVSPNVETGATHYARAMIVADRETDKAIAVHTTEKIQQAQALGLWVLDTYEPICQLVNTNVKEFISDSVQYFLEHKCRCDAVVSELLETLIEKSLIIEHLSKIAHPNFLMMIKMKNVTNLISEIVYLRALGFRVPTQIIESYWTLINED